MDYLKRPFKIGNLTLPSNIFYAPLAGCSDYPFRCVSRLHQPGLIFCEMVKMDALVRFEKKTFHLLDYHQDMHPIGAQICGSKPKMAKQAAKIIEELGFDLIDLNCGCPVDKITKDGSGSGMLKTPQMIGDIICEMVNSVEIPVSVKIRSGWDESHINAPLVTQIAEEAGAQLITIHGRTRQQAYRGKADWNIIKQCKEIAKKIYVFGNGDVFNPRDVQTLFETTLCDGILIARGSLGQPWIAQDVYRFFDNKEWPCHDFSFIKKQFLKHIKYILGYKNQQRAYLDIRRICGWYMKKYPMIKKKIFACHKNTPVQLLVDMIEAMDLNLTRQ